MKKNFRNIFVLLIIFFLIIILFYPNTPQQEAGKHLESLIFTVNDSLLGERVNDDGLGVSYREPLNWRSVPTNTVTKLLQHDNEIQDSIVEIKKIFFNSDIESFIILSELDSINLDDSLIVDNVKQFIHKQYGDSIKITFTEFLFLPFRVIQFQFVRDRFVINKMLFDVYRKKSKIFQVDFISNNEKYPTSARVLESFVGSLQINNNN